MSKKRQIEITWPDGSKTIEDYDFLTKPLSDEEKQSLEEADKYYREHAVDF